MFDEKCVWEYFDGGMPGVKKRICEGVAESFRKRAKEDVELATLEEHIGLPKGILSKIIHQVEFEDGEFNSRLLQTLCACCRLDMHDVFCVRKLSEEEKADIIAAATAEQFVCVCGAGDAGWSQDDRIDLFLLTTALRSLDEK
ncbi:MAG: hypothetical protein M0R80_01815 [Proteobacteria bacterium]|jgi:hypothetical protein|nr:hypothetical protein [Pseudomonadota bacterium]